MVSFSKNPLGVQFPKPKFSRGGPVFPKSEKTPNEHDRKKVIKVLI